MFLVISAQTDAALPMHAAASPPQRFTVCAMLTETNESYVTGGTVNLR